MNKLVVLLLLLAAGSVRADYCAYIGREHAILEDGLRTIPLTACSTHFAAGSAARADLYDALARFNSVHNSAVYFYVAGFSPHRTCAELLDQGNDGVNRLDITDRSCRDWAPPYAGRTRPWPSAPGRIGGFDIAFNDETDFIFGDPTTWDIYNSYFKSVLLHELSHGIGFEHTAEWLNAPSILGDLDGRWIGDREIGLLPHDQAHTRYHYPITSMMVRPMPDLVLSNYRTYPTGGEYHIALNPVPSPSIVHWGGTLTVTWTRFNLGNADVTADYNTRIYLSNDDKLSGDDREIASFRQTATVGRESTFAASRSITMPAGPWGEFWVLVHIDADDEINELDETNNVLPIHWPVHVSPF